MKILGIESSCDDTGVAIVESGRRVLASTVSNQVAIHARFGGVVPEIAAREHLSNIYPLYEEALRQSGLRAEDIDAVAVTRGPGLIGALLVGISFAKGLALSLKRPLIPVDHVHAHIHGALLGLDDGVDVDALCPGFALVVSGGHTHLYHMHSPTRFSLLAASIDDACGECFDKVAKVLGLPYPGGPVIERLARGGDPRRFAMPRVLASKDKMSFSYSGLKTHMACTIRDYGALDEQATADLSAAFQEEAFNQIARKIKLATRQLSGPINSVLVAGGVAANERFRQILQGSVSAKLYFPQLRYCSDNGAMIAANAWYHYRESVEKERFNQHDWDAYSSYRYGTNHE